MGLVVPAAAQPGYPQPAYPQSQSPSIGAEAEGVKSLGTITLAPGEEPSHPWISDEEIESLGLNADHFAWGEAAANAYKAHQYAEARDLWHKAAKTGDPNALFALGVMSERGEGGPKDLDEALGWYYAAQQKGVREATAKVASVSAELRKQAAASAAAGAAAEKRAAEEKRAAAAAAKAKPQKPAKSAAASPAPVNDDAGQLPASPPPKVTRGPVSEGDTQPQNPALRQGQKDSPAPAKKSSAAEPPKKPAPPPKAAKAAPPAPESKQAARAPETAARDEGESDASADAGAASGGMGTRGTETASLPPKAAAPQPSGDSKSKIEQYRRAAANKPEAAFMLGAKYADGRGVPKDDAEAVKFYRMAADKGYAPAENNLGFMYAEGRGVKRDDKEAAKWYRRAADRNYAPAQTSLGMLYAAGRGVEKNDVEALALYSSAANQGYAPATANLAQMYAQGRGIERDEKTAQFLLSAIDEKPREGSGIYVDPGADGAK